MNSWNYRVIKKTDPLNLETIYQVHEVYYGKNGSVECWNDTPVEPMGVNTKGLRNDIQAFLSAFRLPSLEEILQNGKPKLVEELLPTMGEDIINDYAQKAARASDYINQILGNHLLLKKQPALRQAFDKVDQALSDLYSLAADDNTLQGMPRQASL